MAQSNFLEDEQYVSLTTFRRNGTPVATAVWFALDGGKLYVYSNLNAGKMKRVRATGKVEIAPCTVKGKITGQVLSGTAVALDSSRGDYVHGLLNRKYTWKKKLIEFGGALPVLLHVRKKSPDGFIEVTFD